MKLGNIILDNERQQKPRKNDQLIRLRLKELVYTYPKEVTLVLQKTGIKVGELPAVALLAIVTRNLHRNSTLRDAIAKMLLEMDGYLSADGAWAGIVGGALTAVGAVLSGIGQGRFNTSSDQLEMQQRQLELERQQQEQEAARRRRNGWIIAGVSVAVIAAAILVIRGLAKTKVTDQLTLAK